MRHSGPDEPGLTLPGEVGTAVSGRTTLLAPGVPVPQPAFITSYAGAFHQPRPHRAPIDLVAPEQIRATAAEKLRSLPGEPLDVTTQSRDAADARRRIRNRDVDGALVENPAARVERRAGRRPPCSRPRIAEAGPASTFGIDGTRPLHTRGPVAWPAGHRTPQRGRSPIASGGFWSRWRGPQATSLGICPGQRVVFS